MLLLLAALLTQADACTAGDAALRTATARAHTFDLAGAATVLDDAARQGCDEARLVAVYLRAFQAARNAYRSGGDAASLAPVTEAVAALDRDTPSPRTEIIKTVLLAAIAAAQSERDDMALLLEHAMDLERRQLAAGQPATAGVSAHEAAGDLWLQVHRFDTARAAYETAARVVGQTPRISLGLARLAVRAGDATAACAAYRDVDAAATSREQARPEFDEARAYLRASCASPSPR